MLPLLKFSRYFLKFLDIVFGFVMLGAALYVLIALMTNRVIDPKVISLGAMSGFLTLGVWFFEATRKY